MADGHIHERQVHYARFFRTAGPYDGIAATLRNHEALSSSFPNGPTSEATMRSDSEHSFPIQDTVMHVALIGVFAMMIAVTIFVPDVLGITV